MNFGAPAYAYEVLSTEEGHPRLRLIERQPTWDSAGGRKLLVREHKWEVAQNFVAGGLSHAEATRESGLEPQARWLLPYPPDKVYIARGQNRSNERYALTVRHFPKRDHKFDDELLSRLRQTSEQFGAFLGSVHVKHFGDFVNANLLAIRPRSWSEAKLRAVQARLFAKDQLRKGDTVRRFFVKVNEVLGKAKPRGIQAQTEEVALLQCITIRILSEALFHPDACETRSIKHIPTDELPRRLRKLAGRFFRSGRCLSVDFAAWDSTLVNAIRENCENVILEAFFQVVGGFGVVDEALRDRGKTRLRARSGYFDIDAAIFGRESGDGGTSALNFATNMVFSLMLETELGCAMGHATTPSQSLQYRLSNKSWMETVHEGDDTIFLFGAKLISGLGGVTPCLERVTAFYGAFGLVIEPASPDGVSFDAERVMSEVCGPRSRIEFISRFFLWDPTPVSVSKIDRALRNASLTFSHGPIADVALASAISGMLTNAQSPIVREVYSLLHRIAILRGGRFRPELMSFRGREMVAARGWADKYTQLRHPPLPTDEQVRNFYRDEYGLTVDKQIDFEERLSSLVRGTDMEWGQVADILSDLVACV